MKPFHYHEIQNLSELNILERIIALNDWDYICAMIMLGILMFGLFLGIVADYKKKRPDKRIGMTPYILMGSTLLLFSTIIFGVLTFPETFKYKTTGYYEAKVKVENIEKIEKVGETTQYTFNVRLMDGKTEYKKGNPLKIETTQRQGLKNGDIATIKTPNMNFMGGESKNVKYSELIRKHQLEDNEDSGKVPEKVHASNLSIERP